MEREDWTLRASFWLFFFFFTCNSLGPSPSWPALWLGITLWLGAGVAGGVGRRACSQKTVDKKKVCWHVFVCPQKEVDPQWSLGRNIHDTRKEKGFLLECWKDHTGPSLRPRTPPCGLVGGSPLALALVSCDMHFRKHIPWLAVLDIRPRNDASLGWCSHILA